MNPSVVLCTATSSRWRVLEVLGARAARLRSAATHRRPLDASLKRIDWVMVSAGWTRDLFRRYEGVCIAGRCLGPARIDG
jgi:hypothetical protein